MFEIILIAAVTAYGKSQNALQRTIKLGNNQDIIYLDVSIVICLRIQYIYPLTVHDTIFEGSKVMKIVLHWHHPALSLDTIIYWQCVLLGD